LDVNTTLFDLNLGPGDVTDAICRKLQSNRNLAATRKLIIDPN